MCVVSMVMDSFTDKIPWIERYPINPINPFTVPLDYEPHKPDTIKIDEIIKIFKEAVEAARTVDRLTNQPDCEDSEKAKLEARVVELEKLLITQPEFVLVKRQNMQPGKYRVVEGKLHKVIE